MNERTNQTMALASNIKIMNATTDNDSRDCNYPAIMACLWVENGDIENPHKKWQLSGDADTADASSPIILHRIHFCVLRRHGWLKCISTMQPMRANRTNYCFA